MGIVDLLTVAAIVAGLVVLWLIIKTIIDAIREAVDSPAADAAADFFGGTLQSADDLLDAASTGYLPETPGPNQDDAAVNYFASVHDLIAHPIDSLKVLFSWD